MSPYVFDKIRSKKEYRKFEKRVIREGLNPVNIKLMDYQDFLMFRLNKETIFKRVSKNWIAFIEKQSEDVNNYFKKEG